MYQSVSRQALLELFKSRNTPHEEKYMSWRGTLGESGTSWDGPNVSVEIANDYHASCES